MELDRFSTGWGIQVHLLALMLIGSVDLKVKKLHLSSGGALFGSGGRHWP